MVAGMDAVTAFAPATVSNVACGFDVLGFALESPGDEVTARFHDSPTTQVIIDIVGDFAVGMAVGGGVPTINLRIDYVRPAMGSALTATARVRRSGRTVALVDVDVFDEQQSLVAVGRGTYSPQRG